LLLLGTAAFILTRGRASHSTPKYHRAIMVG
jgi:hypothetical protein